MVTTGMTVIEQKFLDSVTRMSNDISDRIENEKSKSQTPQTPDWEQRRWELASKMFANDKAATMETASIHASLIIALADEFIKKYKNYDSYVGTTPTMAQASVPAVSPSDINAEYDKLSDLCADEFADFHSCEDLENLPKLQYHINQEDFLGAAIPEEEWGTRKLEARIKEAGYKTEVVKTEFADGEHTDAVLVFKK